MKSKNFINDIKELSTADLSAKVISLKEELMKLRFKGAAGQLEKPHLVAETKKNIARVKTAISVGKNAASKEGKRS